MEARRARARDRPRLVGDRAEGVEERGNPVGRLLEDCPAAAAAFEEAGIEAEPVFGGKCPSRGRIEELIRELERPEERTAR